MKHGITRRRFISTTAAAGASVSLGGGLLGGLASANEEKKPTTAGVVAINGPDGFDNTIAAVDALGGMSKFVPRGATVVLNANTPFKHRGSIVDPNVLLATLLLCADAGAKEVVMIKEPKEGFWDGCDRLAEHRGLVDRATISEREYEVLEIDGALALHEAHVDKHLLNADVYLNLTLAKHHAGCEYTGALKNTMGACPHKPTCRFFHVGTDPDSEDWYPDIDHLSQCIADLNLVRQPELSILDAGELLITNGPFGPGKLATPQAVVASTDMVALDAFGVRYLDLKPEQVSMIARSERHGLGTSDLAKVGVSEKKLA
jgi:uncharacterized protein (DUF362 family)